MLPCHKEGKSGLHRLARRAAASGPGGTCSRGESLKMLAAAPTNESCLMIEHARRLESFPHEALDLDLESDPSVAPVHLAPPTDDMVHGNGGNHFGLRDGQKETISCNEADLNVFHRRPRGGQPGQVCLCRKRLPEVYTGYFALLLSVPRLCPNPRSAAMAVEAAAISEPETEATPIRWLQNKLQCKHGSQSTACVPSLWSAEIRPFECFLGGNNSSRQNVKLTPDSPERQK